MSGIHNILPYFTNLHMITPRATDVVEILIIAYMIFHILRWLRNTRAWSLLKGFFVILIFVGIAAVFRMNTILWIIQNVLSIAAISVVVILQPELRKALEDLGERNFFNTFLSDNSRSNDEGRFSDKTINEIVRACFEMGKEKTGALIVIRQNQPLDEYERTGIEVDAAVTSQLLINIFEKNTPLHDGAVIISGNRVCSATCYLPLSDNLSLPKHLGTRHRAGVGISEVTDSLTVIVSEETGRVSVAYKGQLETMRDPELLKEKLESIQNKPTEESRKRKRRKEKERPKNEAEA
ncbi:MAG: diadenylate cyclase CdaA [Lachnospiraceae bacterium]|nr:diadenylate cyclase CdaA [Lachnospiraceae bacterium]